MCAKHYERFRRAHQNLPVEIKLEFENQLVETGKLLPANYGGKLQDDEFAALAQKLVAESQEGGGNRRPVKPILPDQAQIAADIAEIEKQISKRPRNTTKRKAE